MRTHLYGWAILGLAVLAPPWDAGERPRLVDRPTGTAALVAGAHRMGPAAPLPVATSPAAIPGPAARAGPGESAASQAPTAVPGSAPAQRPRVAADAQQPSAVHSHLAVRELAPGSKAHSEAIAGNIASQEVQEVVTPLARLYLAYFGRVPDYEGLDYYIGERDRGEPLDAIADEFAGSAEFNARYGALDNAAFVDLVYRNVFGFPAGAQERAYWVDLMESGRLTRGQLMLINSESPGYVAMTANEVFVAIAYAEALGRAPDPAELSRWVTFLDGGNPREAVVEELLADRGKR